MQRQPEACASDLCDDQSRYLFKQVNGEVKGGRYCLKIEMLSMLIAGVCRVFARCQWWTLQDGARCCCFQC